jgi:hypothetical protein
MKYRRAGVSDAEIRIPRAIAEHALTLPKQPVDGFSPFGLQAQTERLSALV